MPGFYLLQHNLEKLTYSKNFKESKRPEKTLKDHTVAQIYS